MRVFGTIPKELHDWIEQEIKSGRYHNTSHVIEVALKVLKEKKE